MPTIQLIHDLVEDNGRTIKENNLTLGHNISVGALVELYSGERLYVCEQQRDCDGTPLYALCMRRDIVRRGTADGTLDDSGLFEGSLVGVVDPELLDAYFSHPDTATYLTHRQCSTYNNGWPEDSLKVIR